MKTNGKQPKKMCPKNRLDATLVLRLPQFSRSVLQRFIREVGVLVNGKRVTKPHVEIAEDDVVQLTKADVMAFLEAKNTHVFPPSPKAPILFSGSRFFVMDKPPFCTTENLARGYFPVHRLDRNTSGVLLVARDAETQRKFQMQWQKKRVQKTYVALLKGTLTPRHGAIEAGIFRSTKDRTKMAISSSLRARASFTEYKVVRLITPSQKELNCSLVKLFPRTGRTHQIRVHCAAIHHPVLGDSAYGDVPLNKEFLEWFGLTHQFLHAEKLELFHPETGKKISFTSKLPADLESVLKNVIPAPACGRQVSGNLLERG